MKQGQPKRPSPNVADIAEPVIIQRVRVSQATSDMVVLTLMMIDSILNAGRKIRVLIGDRHYQYKSPERWAKELLKRNIWQVFQLRAEQQQDVAVIGDTTLWAGFPLCPDLHAETLSERSHPGVPHTQLDASERAERYREIRQFNEQTDSLLVRIGTRHGQPRLNADGTYSQAWEICPVRRGEAGCALYDAIYDNTGMLLTDPKSTGRPATTVKIARQNGRPAFHGRWKPDPNHPDDRTKDTPHPSTACKQTTVTLPLDETLKYDQPFVPGTTRHRAIERVRTYVEAIFGIFKNTSRGNLNRKTIQSNSGLPIRNIHAALQASVVNIDMQRAWYSITRQLPDDIPLGHFMFTDDPPTHGIAANTPWQRAEITAQQHIDIPAGHRTVYELVGHTNDCEPPVIEPIVAPKKQKLTSKTEPHPTVHKTKVPTCPSPGCQKLILQQPNLTDLETLYHQRTAPNAA